MATRNNSKYRQQSHSGQPSATSNSHESFSATELERAVIGALLIESSSFRLVEDKLSEDDFYTPANATIWRVISQMSQAREAVDILTVMQHLQRIGKLNEIGGAVYLSELTDSIVSSVHIEYHALILRQKTVERMMLQTSSEANKKLVEGEDVSDVLAWHSRELEKMQERLAGKSPTQHLSHAIDKSLVQMYKRLDNAKEGKHTGIDTGLRKLNRHIDGWQKQALVVIAARPAMGKTAFALHFAKAAAMQGQSVAIFSLEMSDVSLANRLLLSQVTGDARDFKSGKLSIEQAQAYERAAYELKKLPIYIDDNAGSTMQGIKAKAHILRQRGQCDMVIIDYLQLARVGAKSQRNREQEVAEMSREAKMLAKDLDIPVLLLSQLSREVEKRSDKRPMLSDLRESGAIEQDADMVCFIHRPEYYGSKLEVKGNEVANGIEFIIAKHRDGETGIVVAQHNGALSRIYDYEEGVPSGFVSASKAINTEVDDVPF